MFVGDITTVDERRAQSHCWQVFVEPFSIAGVSRKMHWVVHTGSSATQGTLFFDVAHHRRQQPKAFCWKASEPALARQGQHLQVVLQTLRDRLGYDALQGHR